MPIPPIPPGPIEVDTPVSGRSSRGVAVQGTSGAGVGVAGDSGTRTGVVGTGGTLLSGGGVGVEGTGGSLGVHGKSTSGTGVLGEGGWNGVQGVTANSSASGVWGENTATSAGTCYGVGGKSANGPGVYGTGKPAGRFDGDVVVTGDVQLSGGDCAEEFDIANVDRCDAGTVMVLARWHIGAQPIRLR